MSILSSGGVYLCAAILIVITSVIPTLINRIFYSIDESKVLLIHYWNLNGALVPSMLIAQYVAAKMDFRGTWLRILQKQYLMAYITNWVLRYVGALFDEFTTVFPHSAGGESQSLTTRTCLIAQLAILTLVAALNFLSHVCETSDGSYNFEFRPQSTLFPKFLFSLSILASIAESLPAFIDQMTRSFWHPPHVCQLRPLMNIAGQPSSLLLANNSISPAFYSIILPLFAQYWTFITKSNRHFAHELRSVRTLFFIILTLLILPEVFDRLYLNGRMLFAHNFPSESKEILSACAFSVACNHTICAGISVIIGIVSGTLMAIAKVADEMTLDEMRSSAGCSLTPDETRKLAHHLRPDYV